MFNKTKAQNAQNSNKMTTSLQADSPQNDSLAHQIQQPQSLLTQRAKMSVAAQFKAIGQSHHPLGLSAFKTRSGQGAGKTQRITQKIIHNYEQVILSLSGEAKKQGMSELSPS